MEQIEKYFPNLSSEQKEQLQKLAPLYEKWNAQINVISRKDMEHFHERHVLHSLGIAKVRPFEKGMKVLDVGTGGGFPGIPLAILFPQTHFLLVDGTAKKIKVVQAVADELGLQNVRAVQKRAEKTHGKFDYIIARAVTQMPRFLAWTRSRLRQKSREGLSNGVLYLKGGDLSEEMKDAPPHLIFELKEYFEEEFFETKKVVFVPVG